MSDLDLMEREIADDVELEASAEPAAPKPEMLWPRERMLDRLRTAD